MSSHSRVPSQWRASVASHATRLALATYAAAGLLAADYRLLAPSSVSFASPELYTAVLTSVVGGLTWLAHRTNRAWAARVGGVTLLATAAVHALLAPSTGLAATGVGLMAGAAGSAAVMTRKLPPQAWPLEGQDSRCGESSCRACAAGSGSSVEQDRDSQESGSSHSAPSSSQPRRGTPWQRGEPSCAVGHGEDPRTSTVSAVGMPVVNDREDVNAGYAAPSRAGDHERATKTTTRPDRTHRRWISAIRWIGPAVLGLQIWQAAPGSELSLDWMWLTLSVGVWSSHLGHRDRIIRHGPAWPRAGAIVGALLLPIPSSQLLAAQLSGQSLSATLTILATLALTLLLIAACYWLSTPVNEDVDRDTTSVASQALTQTSRADDPRIYPHAGIYNHPWFF